MNFEQLNKCLLSKEGAIFDYPFDEEVRVYRVCNKIFALCVDKLPLKINLKCHPFYALELRSLHISITAGYHMNKKHWNTVELDSDADDELLAELIDHSYELVVMGLTRKQRENLS
ncbi:MAG: MmcQ/YjbR family DNA-binding protein [Arcobacter sp.]|nr:MmcQ/YjbR family DNA-binding protein [Arcobacter sp.]